MGSIEWRNNSFVIPVVFAVNDNYAAHCYIAVFSLRDHRNPSLLYEIYIFSTDLSEKNQRRFTDLSEEGFHVNVIDIKEAVKQANLKGIYHLSVETYYRLFIPSILTQYDKVLYLDSDICVLDDIADLFCLNLEGKVIGAVREVPRQNLELHCDELGGIDPSEAFNAGVLLIDCRLFERLEVREKCLTMLSEDSMQSVRRLIFADQDALNIVLNKKVKWLEDRWNYLTCFLPRPHVIFEKYRDEYVKNAERASIIHYAGYDKLWMFPDMELAKVFWDYAKKTPFFFDLFASTIERVKGLPFEKYRFPYGAIPCGSRIILYGAGKIGQTFHKQLLVTHYANVVSWVDKEWNSINPAQNVLNPDTILETDYDFILLAFEREVIAREVRLKLQETGIKKEKIIWEKYAVEMV